VEPNSIATAYVRVAIEHREDFLCKSGEADVEVKPIKRAARPEVVWLGAMPPSVENYRRTLSKLNSVPNHRGLVLTEWGPGARVRPEEFEEQARAYLDDGTPEGRTSTEEAVMKAMGVPFNATGLPSDLSRAAVGRLIAEKTGLRAAGHNLYVRNHRMSRQWGVKSWRVLVSPEADLQPFQFAYRGQLVNVNPAPPPKARPIVVRVPKKKPKSKKGTHEDQPLVPKWIPGWHDATDAALPAWGRKTYAQVAAAVADATAVKQEGNEKGGEEAGSAPASPDKAAGRNAPGLGSSRGPHRSAAEVDLTQLAVLLPSLLQMLTAFQEGTLTAGARPMPATPAMPSGAEPPPQPHKEKVAAEAAAARDAAGVPEAYGPAALTAARQPGPYSAVAIGLDV
jgi:hypothetical protein